MKKDFESLAEEAIENIRKDREKTDELLKDLINYIVEGKERHERVGMTMAKYLETLQRSNEQLVKLAALVKKDETSSHELSVGERDKIFDELNSSIVGTISSTKKKVKENAK